MGLDINFKFAETAAELDALYRTRYEVFVEDHGYMETNSDRRLFDRYDGHPTTRNIIAVAEQTIVGGVRVTESSSWGMPLDDWSFDFSPFRPVELGPYGSMSMLCLLPEYRGRGNASDLMNKGRDWGFSQGWSDIVCVVNPPIAGLLRELGYQTLGSELFGERQELPFVPMILQMNRSLMAA